MSETSKRYTPFQAGRTRGVLAVYRMRDDGDADLMAAFDRQNCEAFFEDNSGGGAERLALIVKEGLEFDDEEVLLVEFAYIMELVDVLDLTSPEETTV